MKELFKIAVHAFEAAAVLVLIVGAVISMGLCAKRIVDGSNRLEAYRDFRQSFGSSLLLALDLLVAADIILTVILDLSFETLGMLALLVLIRTFLHFVLEAEVSGRWPWEGVHDSEATRNRV